MKAYAKVNLHLEVLNKRDDGYHNIFSVMANVGLYDLLKLDSFTIGEFPDVRIEIDGFHGEQKELLNSIPLHENLIYKAGSNFCKYIDKTASMRFTLEKNIPAGAGLGGGSSDAAAVLRLLKEVYQDEQVDIYEIGKNIGADVPFCIDGGVAFCEGIGEILTPVFSKLDHWVLVINNGIHVNTGMAYAMLNRDGRVDINLTEYDEKKAIIREAIEQNNLGSIREVLINDFEGPVFKKYPEIYELKEFLYENGSEYAVMTGSGSTVIGLFKEKTKAFETADKLKKRIDNVWLTQFL